MDWSKSKNILIVALLATNLFLLAVLMDLDGFREDDDMQKTLDFLEGNGIHFNNSEMLMIQVPKEMPKLTVAYGENPSKEEIGRALWYQLPLPENPEEKDYKAAADSFLSRLGISTEEIEAYELIEADDGRFAIKYRNYYNGYLLEDSYMKCWFEGDLLVDFERRWLEPQKEESKYEIMDVEKTLRWFVSEQVSELDPEDGPYLIDNIELVYYLPDSYYAETSLETDTAFPNWKVTYNGGEVWMTLAFEE